MDNEELLTHIDRRFTSLEEKVDQVDRRFSAFEEKVDKRFEQVDRRFEQVDHRFEQVEDDVHQTRIAVEATRSDVGLLAEAVVHLNGQVHEAREQPLEQIRDLNTFHELRHKVVEGEVKDHSRQISRLTKRVSALEKRSSSRAKSRS